MNMSILKFNNITYPVFTLKHKPISIFYTLDKIYCVLGYDGERKLLDDRSQPGDYFSRLLNLEDRITFSNTCKNLQDLIISKAKWGIDASAKIHDLSDLYKVKAEQRLVTKIEGNLIWVRNISYPFEISTKESISIGDNMYATIVFVNGEWYLKNFSYDKNLVRGYVYV